MEEPFLATVFMGIGSNLGNREKNLRLAVNRIMEVTGCDVTESSVYETEPMGFHADTRFLNMVARIETDFTPGVLLSVILDIELSMGRKRNMHHYASRVIDIDILFYGNEIINDKSLIVPHPRLHERKFVLVPLAEMEPGFVHPLFNKTIFSLLESCTDRSVVVKQ